jgi:hypothetical protein
MATLTLAEARDQIHALLPGMERQDVEDLFSPDLTESDAVMILESCKEYGALKDTATWDKILLILHVCVEVANIIVPLTNAVSGVLGVVAAVRSV